MRRIRCAIYTRKSSEEGLEQDFNSLDAQREACEAYIASQKHEGWEALPTHYDDGGISGGHLDRPALQRLPAEQVEGLLVEMIRRHLRRPDAAASLTQGLPAAEIRMTAEKLTMCIGSADCMNLFEKVHLCPGVMRIQLDTLVLAKRLNCLPGQINASELTFEAPFQMRRRGVELKLHLGDPPPEIDQTLVQNITKGRRWLAMVIDGKSFSDIADVENVSTRRVLDIANLALIAPDILEAITLGEKPSGLTTDYLIKTRFSAIWSEQRAQFSAL